MADSTSQLKPAQAKAAHFWNWSNDAASMHDFDVGSLYWLLSVCFRCAMQHLHDSSHSMAITYFNGVSLWSSSWFAMVGITRNKVFTSFCVFSYMCFQWFLHNNIMFIVSEQSFHIHKVAKVKIRCIPESYSFNFEEIWQNLLQAYFLTYVGTICLEVKPISLFQSKSSFDMSVKTRYHFVKKMCVFWIIEMSTSCKEN